MPTSSAPPVFVFDRNKGKAPIRIIDLEELKLLQSFPRYPEDAGITKNFEDLSKQERETSLFVFISHCWLRGYPGAEGYDGR